MAFNNLDINKNKTPSVQNILDQNLSPKEKYNLLKSTADRRKKQDLQLGELFSKKTLHKEILNPAIILERNNLPGISIKFKKLLKSADARISPQFIKDEYAYVFRGDYPKLEAKGLYSYLFQEININLDQTLKLLKETPLESHFNFSPKNKLEELMWMHSNGGYENFLSTTTDYKIASKHPGYKQNAGMVYVLKIPVQQAFKNYASVVEGNEQEILVVDYILPKYIITAIDPHKYEDLDIRKFM